MTQMQMYIALISILVVLILAFVFPVGAILVAAIGLIAFLLNKSSSKGS